MKKFLLVTGGDGLVGSHFVENYPKIGNNFTLIAPTWKELDITNHKSVEVFFKAYQPEIIIHFAAFTNVAQAEKERNNKKGVCWRTNVEGVKNLIKAIRSQSFFTYISTDGVFSGLKENPGPYKEDYQTEQNPNLLSWYGWTKREAENLVKSNFKKNAILRIANPARANYKKKLDYVRKILNLFDSGKLYSMFTDQYLTLTYINEVTAALNVILEKRLFGIFHVSSSNVFTPYKLANLLIEKARGKKKFIKPISIESFLKDNPSRYPQYGGLSVSKTEELLSLKFFKWEETIEALAKLL